MKLRSELPVVGQQVVDAAAGMRGDADQDIAQLRPGVDLVAFAGAD